MCVLTGTCNTGKWLCIEADVKTVESEDFLDDDTGDELVVSALESF